LIGDFYKIHVYNLFSCLPIVPWIKLRIFIKNREQKASQERKRKRERKKGEEEEMKREENLSFDKEI
jgi:hypothetical protein